MNYIKIGKDGYDVPSYNKDEEEIIKLQDKVEKWWNDLDYNYKIELMENYYPDQAPLLMEVNEMWNGLDWNDKLDIYREAEGFEVRV